MNGFARNFIGAVACASALCGCSSFHYKEMPAQSTRNAQKNEINAIASSPKIKLSIFKSGEVDAKLSGALNLRDARVKDMSDAPIRVPVYFYLLRHPRFGCVLIDTGCSQEYVDKPFGPMKGMIVSSVMIKTSLSAEETINAILSKERIAPEDISDVYFTHLHFDHTSGVNALSGKTRFFIGTGEKAISIPFIVEPNHFPKGTVFYEMDFNRRDAVETELGKAIDIFGDGSLWAVSTPGHSQGHVSYLVNTENGVFFLAGDAIISHITVETGVGPGTFSANVQQAQKTVDRVLPYLREHKDITIVPGHDSY